MIKNKVLIFAMLIVAIVAVGSVSAADDVAVDIDEPADDIAIEEIAIEDDSADETDEVNDETEDVNYDIDEHTTNIQDVINDREINNHIVNFKPIEYNTTVALTIHGNVTLIGNGATINAISNNNIFEVENATNFTITGFNLNVADTKAAIYGPNVSNAQITNNNITGGKDGINIMHTYDNVTISDNKITGFTRDGISLVNHNLVDNLDDINESHILNNKIVGTSSFNKDVGIFLGGNFKGLISHNQVSYCQYGIQFAGKPTGTVSKISADILYNGISNVESCVNFINETAIHLNFTGNIFGTNNFFYNYTVSYENFANATFDAITFYHNTLSGAIQRSLINMTDIFENWYDGYIWENQ